MLGRSIHKVWAGSVLFSEELLGKTCCEGLFEVESGEGEGWWCVLFVLFNTFTMISSIIDSV